MKTYYLVSLGNVRTSNGTVVPHGKVVASYDLELTNDTLQGLSDLLGVLNVDIVDSDGLRQYREN